MLYLSKKIRNTDCLFIFPPGETDTTHNLSYFLGTAYIISFIRQYGFKANQLITDKYNTIPDIMKMIKSYNPAVIGLSIYNENFLKSSLIAKYAKTLFNDLIIICGGPTATLFPEFILTHYPEFDICVHYEGEETTLELLQNLKKNHYKISQTPLHLIKGISYRAGNSVIINEQRQVLYNNRHTENYLDKYPSPYLKGVIPADKATEIGLISSRGCNQNCTYCNGSTFYKKRIYTHSEERILEELDFIAHNRTGIAPVQILDDNFTAKPERAKRICRAIIANKIKLPLVCVTRCDCVDEELLDLLKAAGVVSIKFSLESAVPRLLRVIGKTRPAQDEPGDDLEKEKKYLIKLKETVAYAKKIKIGYIIVHAMGGLPTETISEAKETLEYINNLEIDLAMYNTLILFPGTELYAKYTKYNYKLSDPNNNPVLFKTTNTDPAMHKFLSEFLTVQKNHEKSLENVKNIKVLCLDASEKDNSDYFSNIVITGELFFDEKFVNWLQIYFRVNGRIVQIFNDKNAYSGCYAQNQACLSRYLSPSTNYTGYYRDISPEGEKWMMGCCENQHIALVKPEVITDVMNNAVRAENNYFVLSTEKSDLLKEIYFLQSLAGQDNVLASLLSKQMLPFITLLCRWQKQNTNCHHCDTLIIDGQGNLKCCWYGDFIGKIGDSITEIYKTLRLKKQEIEKQRKCSRCKQKSQCPHCLYPFPLNQAEYCRILCENDYTKIVESLYALDLFKDFSLQSKIVKAHKDKIIIPWSSFNYQ